MPNFDPKTQELLVGMMMLAGMLVFAAIGIQVITIFRRRAKSAGENTEADLAETFEEAYEAGEIDTDEYRKIKETIERGPILSPVPKPSPAVPGASEPEPSTADLGSGETLEDESGGSSARPAG